MCLSNICSSPFEAQVPDVILWKKKLEPMTYLHGRRRGLHVWHFETIGK